MSEIRLASVGAITLFVEDPQRSKAFYSKVFALTPVFEDANSVAYKFDQMIVNLLQRAEAPGLIEPAKVAVPGTGTSFQLTVWVGDTDAACEELANRGVSLLNGPMNRVWGMRTATFADPDGYIWELAQQIKS